MKNIYLILLAIALCVITSCDDSLPKADVRLKNVNLTFEHTNPSTGEVESDVYSGVYNKEDKVKIKVSTSEVLEKVLIINSINGKIVTDQKVNGKTVDFVFDIPTLEIPFGKSSDLGIYLYYDDKGVDGFNYQSLKIINYTVLSNVPSIVSYKNQEGEVTELPTTDYNLDRFYEDENKGIVASCKAGENSNLEIKKTSLLEFGADKDFSFGFWIKSGDETKWPSLLGTIDWNSSNNQGWILSWLGGRLRFVATGEDADVSKCDFEEPDDIESMVGDQWYYITVTCDRDNVAIIYRNGVETARGAMNPGNIDNGSEIMINQDGTKKAPYYLGADYSNVTFYNYALSPAEVTEEYNLMN